MEQPREDPKKLNVLQEWRDVPESPGVAGDGFSGVGAGRSGPRMLRATPQLARRHPEPLPKGTVERRRLSQPQAKAICVIGAVAPPTDAGAPALFLTIRSPIEACARDQVGVG
jgi:hypothetical protein